MDKSLLILLIASTQSVIGDDCCKRKVVGGSTYTFTGEEDTSTFSCMDMCTYALEGEENSKYCFAEGDEQPECQDSGSAPVGSTVNGGGGADGPTAGGGGAATTGGSGCKCGQKKTSRIVGGQETEVNEYPWMAALATTWESFYCGGTLVASEWVVTASHCLFKDTEETVPTNASEIVIVLGEHDTNSATESVIPRKVVAVTKYIKHPDYISAANGNDIALIKLAEAVDLTVYTPACLAKTGDDFTGKKAWAYGWGALNFGGGYPEKLMEVEVSIVSDSVCQAAVDDLGWTITNGMLCAGGVEGKDSCQGDSGGPLTVDVGGQHTLVGDTSFGYECARANQYGIYAETAVYRAWIDTTVADDGGATYCPA